MLYIGVDLGTSAVKLLMMDENGNIQKIVSKEYPLYFPYPGWSEQNPQDWFAQSMEGIKELTSECDKSQVAGISFGGQMHGLVVLWRIGCQEHFVQICRMHRECFSWTLKTDAGQKKCWKSAVS